MKRKKARTKQNREHGLVMICTVLTKFISRKAYSKKTHRETKSIVFLNALHVYFVVCAIQFVARLKLHVLNCTFSTARFKPTARFGQVCQKGLKECSNQKEKMNVAQSQFMKCLSFYWALAEPYKGGNTTKCGTCSKTYWSKCSATEPFHPCARVAISSYNRHTLTYTAYGTQYM